MKELFDTTVFDAFEISKKCILTKNICLETTEFQLVFCKLTYFFDSKITCPSFIFLINKISRAQFKG